MFHAAFVPRCCFLKPWKRFEEDAASGSLPAFSWMNPRWFVNESSGEGASDQHPDHDVRMGEALLKEVYEKLRASPLWEKTALLITYDEHGTYPTALERRALFTRKHCTRWPLAPCLVGPFSDLRCPQAGFTTTFPRLKGYQRRMTRSRFRTSSISHGLGSACRRCWSLRGSARVRVGCFCLRIGCVP